MALLLQNFGSCSAPLPKDREPLPLWYPAIAPEAVTPCPPPPQPHLLNHLLDEFVGGPEVLGMGAFQEASQDLQEKRQL